ncbi:MAG: terminase small subunit [Patescibacteria group bacterium]|nr:terminase small subunit [Patescibacteria group bacterium]
MTDKERRFIDEYLIDLNGAAAARRAGYSVKTAREIAAENLAKPHIKAEVDARMAERAEACKVNAEEVLREFKLLAFADIGEVFDFDFGKGGWLRLRPGKEISPQIRRCIAQIRVKRLTEKQPDGKPPQEVEVMEFKLWPKPEALVNLAKHLGLVREKHEHTGKDGAPLGEADLEAMVWALKKAEHDDANGQREQSPVPAGPVEAAPGDQPLPL